LAAFLSETIGDGYKKNADELEKLLTKKDDQAVLDKIYDIKKGKKAELVSYIKEKEGIELNADSIFDIQIKRLHEYKRQHLNALHIIADYLFIKNNPNAPFTPKTYIFGAKAAPGYFLAKQIIQMICALSKVIENDPAVKDKLKIVYMEDYRVTLAELLVPAANVSEQISLAGTEASGTGNMKLMLNGAITLGTEDGANVEIHQAVGDDNIVIFGMSTPEAEDLKAHYNPTQYYYNNPLLRQSIDFIGRGIGGQTFPDIVNSLLHRDPYMVLADFESYCRAHDKISKLYQKPDVWNRMAITNTAMAGRFAADRAVEDYARDIWHCKPVK
jgi:starch phosphorylase